MKIIVLFSGGLDSSILCGYLLAKGHTITPLFVERRQRNLEAERRAVTSVVQHLQLTQPLSASIDLPFPPELRAPGLPARNLVLISLAAQYAARMSADAIALGNVIDDDFPDCTNRFRRTVSQTLEVALERRVDVVAPFADWEGWAKSAALQWAARNNLTHVIAASWSCWVRNDKHCGECDACRDRQLAFAAIGLIDPTHYITAPRKASTL